MLNIKHTSAWQHSQDDGEDHEAPTSGTWSKGAPKHSVMNRNSILIQYLKKNNAKIRDEQSIKILDKDWISFTNFSFCLGLQYDLAQQCTAECFLF